MIVNSRHGGTCIGRDNDSSSKSINETVNRSHEFIVKGYSLAKGMVAVMVMGVGVNGVEDVGITKEEVVVTELVMKEVEMVVELMEEVVMVAEVKVK